MSKNRKTLERVAAVAADWVVGGWDNSVTDGYTTVDELPSFDELMNEVYDEMIDRLERARRTHVHFEGKAMMMDCASEATIAAVRDTALAGIIR